MTWTVQGHCGREKEELLLIIGDEGSIKPFLLLNIYLQV